MSKRGAFRFGVQQHRAASAKAWKERARLVESLGYSALYLPDHLNDQLGPIAALMAAADATTTLRVGSLVFDNDYRHPVVLAKEAATIDLMSDGRFDLGLGAGWLASDYEAAGIPYDSPGTRIERMEEGLQIIKGLMAGGTYSFTGKHYQISDMEGSPLPVQKPHPPIVIGGGGRRMLRLAARQADIVNINFDLRDGRVSRDLVRSGLAEATDEKVAWIKEAAGDRLEQIELSVTVFMADITDDREAVAGALASGMGSEPLEVMEMPHFLIGTVDDVAELLRRRRDRFGISFVIVPGDVTEAFAPVVERLAGT
ncbi:MAG TPA: TIGR03621 family F420-dependent LLM class oxidoreductase [Candidatus Dormibacteraeota bacterium]|nr:TIGR03621 family F420-dependent LLM class oxidoreductase [Candidatus Dormibacteraeota bacterium]